MTSQNLQLESEKSLAHRTLAHLDGFLKVVHHGNLIEPRRSEKTPRLCIYFRSLVNQSNPTTAEDFETCGPIQRVHVPVAELMRLPLNVIVKNERLAFDPCAPLPSERIGTFDVDLNEEEVRLINRYAVVEGTDDQYIIPYKHGRSPQQNSDGDKAYYVAIKHNGDPFGIIIPCSEVFRFFYCTSSRMANTILSERILNIDRYIIDPARSGTAKEDPQLAVIWLRQWMFNCDRHHIARLFFTPGAFEEATYIFLRAAGHAEPAYKRALIALPPQHGRMKIHCIHKPFISNGRERIFVTRLVSTDWKLNFREIHFGRDNDSRKTASDSERASLPDDDRPQRSKVLEEGAEVKILEDTSPDDSVAPIEMTDREFESRFPELEKIYSPQIPKAEQKTKNDQGRTILATEGSLVEASSSGHEGLISLILTAAETAADIKNDDQDGVAENALLEEIPVATTNKLIERIEAIESAAVTTPYQGRLKVSYLRVLEQGALVRGRPVNILPIGDFPDPTTIHWFFIDKARKQPRPVVVVRLELDQRIRYLIDFMHKDAGPDTSSLILWSKDEGEIVNLVIENAILTCMRNKSVNLKDGELMKRFCGGTRKHIANEDPAHLVNKIFTTEDKMKTWVNTGNLISPQ